MCVFADSPKAQDANQTVLTKYMDFNTSYYTKKEYEKSFSEALHDKNEDIADNINLKDLRLLLKDTHITKNAFYRYKKLTLTRRYVHIEEVLKDGAFLQYMANKDKTARLSLFITNKKKAIAEYLGGDNRCLWSTKYLFVLRNRILEIYQIGGFTGEYAPVLLVVPKN